MKNSSGPGSFIAKIIAIIFLSSTLETLAQRGVIDPAFLPFIAPLAIVAVALCVLLMLIRRLKNSAGADARPEYRSKSDYTDFSSYSDRRGSYTPAAHGRVTTSPVGDVERKLEDLRALYDAGIMTREEYTAKYHELHR